MESLVQLDGKILLWIQENLRVDFITPFMKFITSLGDGGFIWIALIFVFLVFKKTRITGGVATISLLVTFIVNNLILKNLIHRTRPYEVLNDLELIIHKPGDFSFPSGHTASSFAVAVVLYCLLPKKFGVWFLVLAVFIAFSRLYVGVHYPTDVLGGMLVGTMCAVVSVFLYRKRKKNEKDTREVKK